MKSTLARIWTASALLLLVNIAGDWLFLRAMGGDSGAFLFVTLRFVVVPALCIALIAYATVTAVRATGALRRLSALSAALVPCVLLLIAVTGDDGFLRWFPL
jgi:hypothetical protein